MLILHHADGDRNVSGVSMNLLLPRYVAHHTFSHARVPLGNDIVANDLRVARAFRVCPERQESTSPFSPAI